MNHNYVLRIPNRKAVHQNGANYAEYSGIRPNTASVTWDSFLVRELHREHCST